MFSSMTLCLYSGFTWRAYYIINYVISKIINTQCIKKLLIYHIFRKPENYAYYFINFKTNKYNRSTQKLLIYHIFRVPDNFVFPDT